MLLFASARNYSVNPFTKGNRLIFRNIPEGKEVEGEIAAQAKEQKPKLNLRLYQELASGKIPRWLEVLINHKEILVQVLGNNLSLEKSDLENLVAGKLERRKAINLLSSLSGLRERLKFILRDRRISRDFAETASE